MAITKQPRNAYPSGALEFTKQPRTAYPSGAPEFTKQPRNVNLGALEG
jgi:hypothetical protein